MAKFRVVKQQRTWVQNTGKPCREQSPYWRFLADHSRREDGQLLEPPVANPDVLAAPDDTENEALDYIRAHWREIGFTKQQIKVLNLVAKGLKQVEIAARAGVTPQRVSLIIKAVQKKAAKWYEKKFS